MACFPVSVSLQGLVSFPVLVSFLGSVSFPVLVLLSASVGLAFETQLPFLSEMSTLQKLEDNMPSTSHSTITPMDI